MQRLLLSIAIFFCLATTVAAQIGKTVSVAAGTDEDKALTEIYAAPDGPAKIALLEKFMADFGKGDLELLGDQLLVQSYLSQKNYARVYEYGDKVLKLDPDNFSTVVNMMHAADEQGDTPKMFTLGEKAAAIIARYKATPAPEGSTTGQWSAQKEQNLKDAQPDIEYVERTLFNTAYKTKDAAARAGLYERYPTVFPDSPYTSTAREKIAFAYQQAQLTSKMVDAAQNALVTDPVDISMLVLLA